MIPHHSGIPGGIIPLYPGDFVGIRILDDIAEMDADAELDLALGQNANSGGRQRSLADQ